MADKELLKRLVDRLRSGGFDSQTLPDGSSVLLDLPGNRVLTLSATGTKVVAAIEAGTTEPDALLDDIVATFAVDPMTAARDLESFLSELDSLLVAGQTTEGD